MIINEDYHLVAPNLYLGSLPRSLSVYPVKYSIDCVSTRIYDRRSDQMVLCTRFEDNQDDPSSIPPDEFLHSLAEMVNILRRQSPVLVHCFAGLNRSGLICALAIMKEENLSAAEVITRLRDIRSPDVLTNSLFERWLHQQNLAIS